MIPIRLESGEYLSFDLSISRPLGKELAIVVHGTMVTKENWLYEQISKNLVVNCLKIDLPGNGRSEGTFSIAGYAKEVMAVQAAVKWAQEMGFEVVSLIGHSKGGNIVLMHSALYPGVPSIISLAARYDMTSVPGPMRDIYNQAIEKGEAFHTFNEKTFKIDREGVRERLTLDMDPIIKKVSGKILLIHGTCDKIIPFKDSESIFENLEIDSKFLHLLPSADHFFTERISELLEKINEFLINLTLNT
jgi:pimeloyl-ACP methyl ester carboxylesterase